ncbi:MAG TPA: glycine betaine ABC transporter substrate-binding protein [Terriglobia bacterium]|nr:glycine betaine ABC transporter substrate-binding protein [Terriglobia bacterium]
MLRRRLYWLLAMAVLALASCGPPHKNVIVVGSKNFAEQEILGELLAQHIHAVTGLPVERRFYLAGTYIAQQAILAGRIDTYVEYTGTALEAILKQSARGTPQQVFERVKAEYAQRYHLSVMPSLGFEDSFAIVIRGDDARRYHLSKLSQLAPIAPKWRAGFGYEFMERQDGYRGFVNTYHLHFAGKPRIMDLGLLYRALISRQVDLVAGNSTDGLIEAYHLVVLQDDQHYFPPYQAVPVVRQKTLELHPAVRKALEDLAGKISTEDMRKMNYEVVAEHRPARSVVSEFRKSKGL